MKPEVFESYLSRALDRDLTAEEFAEFEQELIASPEARALYLEYVDVHTVLDLELNILTSKPGGSTKIVDMNRVIRSQRRKSVKIAAIAAAAICILSLIAMQFYMMDRAPKVVFQSSPGTQFTLTHSNEKISTEAKSMQPGSRLELAAGTVELTFASGVRSIVTAPADITLHADDTLFINRGTAWFEVPQKAIGFTVNTDELNIIDLGTQFGVCVKPDEHDEVHVFKGKVKVHAQGLEKESAILVAGEARTSDPDGRLSVIPVSSSAFVTNFLQLPPYLYWSFDESDGFEVKGSHPAAAEIVSTPSPADSPPHLVEGKFGSALSLDGNQQSLMTDWEGIYGADQRLSCAVWVRIPEGLDLTHYSGVVGWGIPGNSNAKWKVFVRQAQAGHAATVHIAVGTNNGMYRFSGKTRLDDDEWHHIAVVDHGIQPGAEEPVITLFIDGEEEPVTPILLPVGDELNSHGDIQKHPLTKPFAIGKGPIPQDVTFRGLIDELYIFDGAISQTEIRNLITPPTTNKP